MVFGGDDVVSRARLVAACAALSIAASCSSPYPVPTESHAGHQTPAPSAHGGHRIRRGAHQHDTRARPAAERDGVDSWRDILDGLRGVRHARRAARASGRGRRILDGSRAGHQRRIRAVRRSDRLRHGGRTSTRTPRIIPACRKKCSCRDRRCSIRHRSPFRSTIRCSGGATRRARAGNIPRVRAAIVRDRADHPVVHIAFEDVLGVREVGGQAAADRGRVRVRRARRARSESVSVGQRADAGQQAGSQHLAGHDFRRRTAAKTDIRARRR